MMESLAMNISPEAQVDDVKALLDSYAVRWEQGELVFLHMPLFFVPWEGLSIKGTGLSLLSPIFQFQEQIEPDPQIAISLTRFEPHQDANDRRPSANIYTRWPFFVDGLLTVTLLAPVRDQPNARHAWSFKFEPGCVYEERRHSKEGQQ